MTDECSKNVQGRQEDLDYESRPGLATELLMVRTIRKEGPAGIELGPLNVGDCQVGLVQKCRK